MAVGKSNEGGREVMLGGGQGAEGTPKVGSGRGTRDHVSSEPMRVEADAGLAGAADDDSVRYLIDSAAENIARLHPSHAERKASVAAKLKAAIEAL